MMNLLVRVTDTNDMTLTILKSLLKNKCKVYGNTPGPEVIKLSMLNSVEHGIVNAHKDKNIFLGSDKPRALFFPLLNVKMPTIVGILTFYEHEKFHARLS